MNLAGRRVLVTGAAGGIGSALVRALIERGASVLIAGRDPVALQRLAVSLPCERDTTFVCAGDLANAVDRARLCDAATRWQGGIDTLVNNAAVSEFGFLATQEAEAVARIVSTNVLAPIELCRQLLPHLRRQPQAHIVNIGSVFGSIGYAGSAVYAATKFALRGFSESLRRECADSTVKVHYFAPRATATSFNSTLVDRMNVELGNATDTPDSVAQRIVSALEADRVEAVFGWPERLFVRINAVLPRFVDRALRKQLPVIGRFSDEAAQQGAQQLNRRRVG